MKDHPDGCSCDHSERRPYATAILETVVERKKAWNRLFEVLDTVEEKKPRRRKKAKLEEEEIADMVKNFRKRAHG